MEDIPKSLPVLITGGSEDPVSSYGDALKRLCDIYRLQLQMKNVDIKIYDGYRHELQQETGREKVFADQLDWIKKVISGEN